MVTGACRSPGSDGDHSTPFVEGMRRSLDPDRVAQRAGDALEGGLHEVVGVPARASARRAASCAAAVANARQNSSTSCGSNGGSPQDLLARGTRPRRRGTAGPTGRAPRRSAPRRAAPGSTRTVARRPCRRAPSRNTSPSRMPTSSTVWWASISRSPVASIDRSNPPWRPSWPSMWSKNGSPVDTSTRPVPSIVEVDGDVGLLGGAGHRGDARCGEPRFWPAVLVMSGSP